jgi:uncharacterized protein YaiL (DUF2058 family)
MTMGACDPSNVGGVGRRSRLVLGKNMRPGGMEKVIEPQPSKHKVLSSNLSNTKKRNKRQKTQMFTLAETELVEFGL